MIDNICQDAEQRMLKTLSMMREEFSKIRTGRAHPSLLRDVMVSCYGSELPLQQVANINIQDARTLSITAFDQSTISAIEKAIMSADLGLNPVTQGVNVRVFLPPLTEDRRKELIKVVKSEAEKAKVAIRNIRRDANQVSKDALKEKQIAEDEHHSATARIQHLTDSHIKEIDVICVEKEKEMLEI